MRSNENNSSSVGAKSAVRVDSRKQRTIVKDTMKEYFETRDMEEGCAIWDDKLAPGTVGTPLAVDTNCWGIKVEQQFPVYQYDITIEAFVSVKRKGVFLTKKTDDCPMVVENKAACRGAFKLVVDIYGKLFTDKDGLFYDLQSLLYTTYELTPPQGTNMVVDNAIVCILRNPDFAREPLLQQFDEVRVQFKRVERETEVIAGDKSQALNRDTDQYDRQPCNFLEIGISQSFHFNPEEFISFPGGKAYLKNPKDYIDPVLHDKCANFSQNKYIAAGVKKGIRFVSGKNGNVFFGMFVYPFKTAFFREQSVADFLYNNKYETDPRALRNASSNLRGMTVFNKLAPRSKIKIDSISAQNARNTTFDYNNRKTTVEEYFYEMYGYELQYPLYPLVCGKNGKKLIQFPAEVAMIADNQAAQKHQFEQREDADAIKICAQPPAQLKKEISKLKDALGIVQNPKLKKMGIHITPTPLSVNARVLPVPTLNFDNNGKLVPSAQGGDWAKKALKYSKRGKIGKWAVVSVAATDCSETRDKFAARLSEGARAQGIEMPAAPTFSEHHGDAAYILQAFKKAKELGVVFIFFVTDLRMKLQGYLKLQERLNEIGTQNVTLKIAMDVATGKLAATLENILHKTNLKFGGLNYDIDLLASANIKKSFGSHPLIVGVSMSHLGAVNNVQQARGGAKTEESLSGGGYAANSGKNSIIDFVGDHFPIKAYRNEIFDSVAFAVQRAAVEFQKNRENNVVPTSVVLYLTGSSEGDCNLLLKYQLPLLQISLKAACGGKDIPLTVIIPYRLHLAKLFRKDIPAQGGVKEQNLPPGTLVDQGLVHPTINEFYLQAHMAVQGTARSVKYIVLKNTNKSADMNGIAELTNQLCYGYQISNSPCALPAPCMIAADYAARGAKMYKEIGEQDTDVLNERYGYYTSTKFKDHRINA